MIYVCKYVNMCIYIYMYRYICVCVKSYQVILNHLKSYSPGRGRLKARWIHTTPDPQARGHRWTHMDGMAQHDKNMIKPMINHEKV